jgi:hypothetical protein
MINRRFDDRASCLARLRAMLNRLLDKQGIVAPAA